MSDDFFSGMDPVISPRLEWERRFISEMEVMVDEDMNADSLRWRAGSLKVMIEGPRAQTYQAAVEALAIKLDYPTYRDQVLLERRARLGDEEE